MSGSLTFRHDVTEFRVFTFHFIAFFILISSLASFFQIFSFNVLLKKCITILCPRKSLKKTKTFSKIADSCLPPPPLFSWFKHFILYTHNPTPSVEYTLCHGVQINYSLSILLGFHFPSFFVHVNCMVLCIVSVKKYLKIHVFPSKICLRMCLDSGLVIFDNLGFIDL